MATLKILLRPSSGGADQGGSLCLRFIHRRVVRQLTTPIKLLGGEWDEQAKCLRIPAADSTRCAYLQSAQSLLDEYQARFQSTVSSLDYSGGYHTDDVVRRYRMGIRLMGLKGFCEQQALLLERTGHERTARAYRTATRMLVTFNKGQDVPLKYINRHLIRGFESWLKNRSRAMNTVSFHMRMLRALYRRAIYEKIIPPQEDNPFEGVFTGFCRTRKRSLSLDEMRRLDSLDFSRLLNKTDQPEQTGKENTNKGDGVYNPKLYMAWRLFMFCFHARGMSFVDMAYLRKTDIREGMIGYYRRKTGRRIEVGMSPTLERIIDSFSQDTIGSPYVFPIIRDLDKPARQQYETALCVQNRRLKTLARLAGIESPVSTHVSRHSWATLGKKQRLPLWVISEGLGHASEKMTYTYLASFDTDTLERASRKITSAIHCPPSNAGVCRSCP